MRRFIVWESHDFKDVPYPGTYPVVRGYGTELPHFLPEKDRINIIVWKEYPHIHVIDTEDKKLEDVINKYRESETGGLYIQWLDEDLRHRNKS